jgi:hypothetical protein
VKDLKYKDHETVHFIIHLAGGGRLSVATKFSAVKGVVAGVEAGRELVMHNPEDPAATFHKVWIGGDTSYVEVLSSSVIGFEVLPYVG